MNKEIIITFLVIAFLVSVQSGSLRFYNEKVIQQLAEKFMKEFFEDGIKMAEETIMTVDYTIKITNRKLSFPPQSFSFYDYFSLYFKGVKQSFDAEIIFKKKKYQTFNKKISHAIKYSFLLQLPYKDDGYEFDSQKFDTSNFEGFERGYFFSAETESSLDITNMPYHFQNLFGLFYYMNDAQNEIDNQMERFNIFIKKILKNRPQDTQLSSLPVKIDSNFVLRRTYRGVNMELGQSAWINSKQPSDFKFFRDYSDFEENDDFVQITNEDYLNSITKALYQAEKFNIEEELKQMKMINKYINIEKFFPGIYQKIDESEVIKIKYKANEQPNFKIENNEIHSYWNFTCTLIGYQNNVATNIQEFNILSRIRLVPKVVDSTAFSLIPVDTVITNISVGDKNIDDLKDFLNYFPETLLSGISHWQLNEVYRFDDELFVINNPQIDVYDNLIRIKGEPILKEQKLYY